MSWPHTSRAFAACTTIALCLSACSTAPIGGHGKLPDTLADTGVVIVETYGSKADPEVDGNTAAYLSDENRHLVMSLPVGEHTLNDLTVTDVQTTYPGGPAYFTTTKLPLNRKFRIEAGKVTNLGLFLIVPNPKDAKQFYTFTLDNSASAMRYFRASYPKLAAGMKDSDFILAPGSYVAADKIALFRRMIATNKVFYNKYVVEPGAMGKLVVGPAGLIGEYVVKGNRVVDIRILDTGTLANAVSVTRLGERYVIAMSDGSLFRFEQEKLTPLPPPAGAAPIIKAKLLSGGLVLVDARLRAYMSSDEGRHWNVFTGAQTPPDQVLDNLEVVGGAGRTFFYPSPVLVTDDRPMHLFFTDDDKFAFKAMPAPGQNCVGKLVSTPAGAFYGPCETSVWSGDAVLLFEPRDASAWQNRPTPPNGINCNFAADGSGSALYAECGSGTNAKRYRSADSAKTWQPVALR